MTETDTTPRLLAIDAGNTRIKWGIHDGASWVRRGAVATDDTRGVWGGFGDCQGVGRAVVSNVAGDGVRQVLEAAIPKSIQHFFVRSCAMQCGVRNGYASPSQLGCDRWAALIGAFHLFGGPAVVANAGTTLTVDALTGKGDFVGGVIVPGVALMARSLAAGTAGLPMQAGGFQLFPTTTGDAIASGAVNALCGAIERMARFLERRGGDRPLCVLSGGAASLLAPQLNLEVKEVDNLVLEGLLQIAREN